jgi:hypothetical protein
MPPSLMSQLASRIQFLGTESAVVFLEYKGTYFEALMRFLHHVDEHI